MNIAVWLYKLNAHSRYQLDAIIPALNDEDKRRAGAFYQVEDKYRFLAGRWLLQQWLLENQIPTPLTAITLDEYKRPGLNGISFSITHTGKIIGLAATTGHHELGLDIEESRPLQPYDYMLPFTGTEQEYIKETNSQYRFYEVWTKKEAILKAIGKGFLLDPATVEVLGSEIVYAGTKYYTTKLEVGAEYMAHITTVKPLCADIQIRWMN